MKISVAIDGPAGAGKSTIAKILGEKFDLMYINTGAMYRAVTLMAQRYNIPPTSIAEVKRLVEDLEIHFEGERLIVNNEDISDLITLPEISNNVSNYAAIPEVRDILVMLQKNISKKYNVVMDGRDIGTVVLKDAPFKFYLTASAEERANRRYTELKLKGIEVDYNNILDEIIKRDYIDMNREVTPLIKAEDAIEIDSSNLSIYEVVDVMANHIRKNLLQE